MHPVEDVRPAGRRRAWAPTSSTKLGIDTQFNGADWPPIRDRIFGRIDRSRQVVATTARPVTPNVTLIEGTARFVGDKTFDVEVPGARTRHDHRAARVDRGRFTTVDSADRWPRRDSGFHTSDSIMRLAELPKRLGIIGGGFIAVEMGHVFSALGSEVTLFNRSTTSAPRLRRRDRRRGSPRCSATRVDLRLGHVPTEVERDRRRDRDHVRRVDDRRGRTAGRDRSTSPTATCSTLGGRAGARVRRHGTIEVDDTMATDRRRRVGDRRHRQQLPAQAPRERRGVGGVLEHRPPRRPAPSELQGGAERRVLATRRSQRSASPRQEATAAGPALRRRASATTPGPRTAGRSSTRRPSPRCSSTPRPG